MTSRDLDLIGMVGCQALHPKSIGAPKALETALLPSVGSAVAVLRWALLGVTAITAAVWLVRRRRTRRLLASRVTYTLLPSLSFEPSKEDVERFALQLTRTRPAESHFRPRTGSAVRITLSTDGEARLTYRLAGPRHADSVLRHPTYAQVEILAHDAPGQTVARR